MKGFFMNDNWNKKIDAAILKKQQNHRNRVLKITFSQMIEELKVRKR